MRLILRTATAVFLTLSLGFYTGCSSEPDASSESSAANQPGHDHEHGDHAGRDHEHGDHSHGSADLHDMPLTEAEIAALKDETATYPEAVKHIQEFQQTIETETTAGDPVKAHRALDNLDIVLENLPSSAQNSEIPKARWQEINEAAQDLRDLFNQVHARIDAGENPDYAAVSEDVNRLIAVLVAIE